MISTYIFLFDRTSICTILKLIYFDSEMYKSTNTVVYFDWKTVIYIYACGKCQTQFMLPMEMLVKFTGACAYDYVITFISQFFPGSPVSSTNKTDRNVITEILLKVALSTINQTQPIYKYALFLMVL
jgi:predicted metal-binding protein